MKNKVTKKECMDAIDYFWNAGCIESMYGDKLHYIKILLKKVANIYKIKLEENDKNLIWWSK